MKVIQNETNIGLIRPKNEDVAISMTHPKDKNIILLLVADGMGGKEHGDAASSYVAESIKKWFSSQTALTLNNFETVNTKIRELLEKNNNYIIKKYGENVSGTTLTLAIINQEKTFVLNSGDSRTYIYRKNKLIQVTEDDSDVWFYYKYGVVNKDDLRFFYNNNLITACIGLSKEMLRIDTNVIQNNYDMILLFSDGVTDLITDRKIKKIIENSPKQKILNNIIDEAVNKDQNFHIPLRLKRKKFSKYILPFKGRDNASGAIYIIDSYK